MKKVFSLITVISVLFLLQSCKQESAEEYNNKIINQQVSIVKQIDNLKKSIDDYNILPAAEALKNMDKAYDSTVFQIDSGLAFMETVKPFKKDNSLQEASKTLFNAYKGIVEQDFKQIIELYKLPDSMFTTVEQKKLDSLINLSNQKLQEVYDNFMKSQKSFAKKYKLNLV